MADKGVVAGQRDYLAKVRQAGMQVDAGEARPASDGSFDPSLLFEPLDLGPVKLPNRIVMAPMTRNMSPGGVPGADVAAYYRRRAEGGVGLIVTEGHIRPAGRIGLFRERAPLLWRGRARGLDARRRRGPRRRGR